MVVMMKVVETSAAAGAGSLLPRLRFTAAALLLKSSAR